MKGSIHSAGKDDVQRRNNVGWFLHLCLAAFLQIGGMSGWCRAWEIKRFVTEITVHKDTHITVTERLRVDFGGELRHGIFRTIPFRYKRHVGMPVLRMVSLPYNLRFKVRSVTNALGAELKYLVSRKGGYIEIRIGDPNVVVSGVQDYVITYDVWRALIKLPTHVELYWNATGNEWHVPIGEAIANVRLPEGVNGLDNRSVKAAFYTGPYGSTECNGWMQRTKDCISFGTGKLEPGWGLTIVVGMPTDAFSFPSAAQNLTWTLQDNWHIVIALVAPLIALICMLALWYRSGRDPHSRFPIVVQYEPPKDLTPAEVGTLVDERADVTDITATVIDLAVRGYIKIRELKATKFLFLTDRDYEFTLLKPPDDSLEEHERLVLVGMFNEGGEGDRVFLSQLRNKFYKHLPGIQRGLYKALTKRKRLFYGDPDIVRGRYRRIGTIIAVMVGSAIFVFSKMLEADPTSMLIAVFGVSISWAVVWFLAPLMPRKSYLGVEAMRHILGFREFIMRVEKDRLERMASEDPTLFGRILPYAIVLGVADEWAEKMRDIVRHPPEWYVSDDYSVSGFNSTRFVHDIGRAMQTMNSTFISMPREAGSSGFSGGSSGGGFGGGGGGAW